MKQEFKSYDGERIDYRKCLGRCNLSGKFVVMGIPNKTGYSDACLSTGCSCDHITEIESTKQMEGR